MVSRRLQFSQTSWVVRFDNGSHETYVPIRIPLLGSKDLKAIIHVVNRDWQETIGRFDQQLNLFGFYSPPLGAKAVGFESAVNTPPLGAGCFIQTPVQQRSGMPVDV